MFTLSFVLTPVKCITLNHPRPLHCVNDAAPAAQDIAIGPRHQDLCDRLLELLRPQVLPVNCLAHALHHVARGTAGGEILGVSQAPNRIVGRYVAVPLRVDPRDDRLDEEGPPPVQTR